MKTSFYSFLAAALLLTACDETDISKNTPSCIRQKTINLERDTPCEEGASVKEYIFQGKSVYVFNPGSCIADASFEVADEQCNTLGYLGGFSGGSTINGEPFSKAEFKRTIWEQ
ncbi:hypothetical protein GCM10027346_09850 [Hymenobacter seoulensis]